MLKSFFAVIRPVKWSGCDEALGALDQPQELLRRVRPPQQGVGTPTWWHHQPVQLTLAVSSVELGLRIRCDPRPGCAQAFERLIEWENNPLSGEQAREAMGLA